MTESRSLDDLIRSIARGDSSAYEALYMKMRQPLYNHVLSRYGSILGEPDAEDVIHNIFLKIPRYSLRYRGKYKDASARRWIYKVAHSEAMKMVRARNRAHISLDDHPDDDESRGSAISQKRNELLRDPDWELDDSLQERVERTSIVRGIRSVAGLAAEECEFMDLRYVYGYTYQELGAHIGRTKPRAKQKHDGILERIRKALKRD